ncbi:hypothetical protein COCSUDRAFT_60155 [Coccomyxa subellipsoidea C-169]|uniref:Uncharacterized protein n=1 Tax=Coccomyxa subellipsoidea (strain C-169) TaxID=574566 RepID=I0YJC0_COCSC|nr:hypothetical protein COCSUDRAFT_60155 [Coccomyxa subellipsoidea C-169]EIE18489.1 hypothetical protein COCSUDRAFT_60155 [Coccomyxa subellipsoidea C-169]|eukprot:XP_005643033.1 hypothetical protein COCSUDRAFT_60155 [Coccomyxa subellipsoidea C-169]
MTPRPRPAARPALPGPSRASMVAGEHRALGMARQSIALASSAAASPANAHAAAQHSDHTAPASKGARQPSYTVPLIIHIGGGPKVH